jgi:hypothetical protein
MMISLRAITRDLSRRFAAVNARREPLTRP